MVVGYLTYLDLIREILQAHQTVIGTGMTKELERGRAAIQAALDGKKVVVVSSGDPGVYGMAGVILELLARMEVSGQIPLTVVPGVTAATAAAAALGAPLMHDFACISLSDLLTPWPVIEQRLAAAAQGDFVMVLYNPKSRRRVQQIEQAREIILQYRRPDTPVGLVHCAGRGAEQVTVATLQDFTGQPVDMLTTVIIGNSQSYIHQNQMLTPRGYRL